MRDVALTLRLGIRQRIEYFEALHQVAAADALVRDVNRAVTVQTRARLLGGHLSFGIHLVFEHVGVSPLFAEVARERIACPELPETRILFQSRFRDEFARVLRT